MKKDILVDLLNAQAHFGHQRQYRTPQLKKYIHTTISKVDIINLDLTILQINVVKDFLLKNKEKDILIVSNREVEILGSKTQRIQKMKKWKPGYISNFNFGSLDAMPDIIIVDKVAYNDNLVREAVKAGITIVGFCDTNTPANILKSIDYPVIINDDSSNAIRLLLSNLLD